MRSLTSWFLLSSLIPTIVFAESGFSTPEFDALTLRDCDVAPAAIVDTLPIPEMTPLPECHDDRALRVEWQPIDSPDIERFFLQVARDAEFTDFRSCAWFLSDATAGRFVFEDADQGHIWVRLFSAAWDEVNSRWTFSTPSDSITTILDFEGPVVVNLQQDLIPATWADGDPVVLRYEATDVPVDRCTRIQVTEDPESVDLIDLPSSCTGSLEFILSPGLERKTVYARMQDCAGNWGAWRSLDSVTETESHSYPNPFDPRSGPMNIVFGLEESNSVTLRVFNLFGELVRKKSFAGEQGLNDGGSTNPESSWDGRNDMGEIVADGGYVCLIDAGGKRFKHLISVIK